MTYYTASPILFRSYAEIHRNITTKIVTPNSVEPVSVADLKSQARINTGTAEDTVLNRYLVAAREMFEFESDGYIVNTTTFTQFQPSWFNFTQEIQRGNVQSISTIQYYDQGDTLQTLTNWQSDLSGTPALVYYPPQANTPVTWPILSVTRPRPVQITYTAGVSTGWPADVSSAILWLAAHYYRTREAFLDGKVNEAPMSFLRVAWKFKTGLGGY